jgi:hypothetical protein
MMYGTLFNETLPVDGQKITQAVDTVLDNQSIYLMLTLILQMIFL